VQMHGVNLTLEADNARLIEYASEHLQSMVTEPVRTPDILVRCHWSEGEWDPETNPFQSNSPLNVIGNRMLGRPDELVWLDNLRMRGLQLRFSRDGSQFVFDVAYRFCPRRATADSRPAYEYKKFFSLMRYLVYHPFIWHLSTFRGWTVLHASGLESAFGGIIIAGLAGTGKSTTCVALMQQARARIISENLILTDGEFVYPCYEPIRLDEGSLRLLGNGLDGLIRMTFPAGVKEKTLFHLLPRQLPKRVKPSVLFLPQFAPHRYLRELSPSLAVEKIIAINALVRELDDYEWYAAALAYLWPEIGRALRPIEVIRRRTEQVKCFELGVDPTAGVEAVVDDIVSVLADNTAPQRTCP